jgi:prepilin-type N-terminal cleavage/methylation domain-containing protein
MTIVVGVNPLQTEKGFTLIEALIALGIFSIGILAVTSLLVSSNMQSRRSAEITEASAIAINQMEELMLIPFDHSDLSSASNPHTSASGKYQVQWNAIESDLNNDAINESKTIELAVTWNKINSGTSNQRRVRLFFIKHNQ